MARDHDWFDEENEKQEKYLDKESLYDYKYGEEAREQEDFVDGY